MDESLRKQLLKQAKEDKRRFAGAVPVGLGDGKAGVRRLSQDASEGTRFQGSRAPQGSGTFEQAPVRKRTETERVDSLANRLWGAVQNHNPGEMERILQMMQVEGWKQGSPVSFEDVKRIAINQMKLAAEKAKLNGG